MEQYEINVSLLELKMYLQIIQNLTYSYGELNEERLKSIEKTHSELGLVIIKANDVISELLERNGGLVEEVSNGRC